MADEQVEQDKTSNEPTVKVSDWAKKFSSSEKIMLDEFLPKFNLAKERLRSEHTVKGRGSRNITNEQVNIVQSVGINFVNSVYFKSPNVNLTARNEADYEKIENTEVAVNDWLVDKKVKRCVKRAIWDAYLGGFGGVFIDYEYDDMDDPSRPVMEQQPTLDEFGNQIVTDVQAVDDQGNPLFERIVLKNEVTIQRLRPDLVRFPKGFDFDNYQDSPWIGFDLIVPIEEVKSNELFDQEVSKKIEGERYEKLSSSNRVSVSSNDKGSDLYAKISYCFIKPSNPKVEPFQLIVFCSKCDEKPLLYTEFKKGHVGYPIHFIYFNPLDDDCSYPNGDPWNFEAQLNATDLWWKTVYRHVKRSNPKMIYDSGAVNVQEAQKLKSNNDNELVGVSNKDRRDLRSLIMNMEAPKVHEDIHKLYEISRQIINEVSPKSAMMRGSADEKADTATEAKIIQAGEMIDTDARIDDVRDFIKDIVLDVAGILSESLVAPIPVNREDELGNEVFDVVGSDGFTGDVGIDVDVESMQAQNKDVLRKHLLEAMSLIGQLQSVIAGAGKQPDPVWWFEKLLDTMYIRNIDKAFMDIQMPTMPLGQTVPPNQGGTLPPNGEAVPPTVPDGSMPPEAIEAGLSQRL